MENVQALEKKIEGLKEAWEAVAFDSEIKAEKRYEILGKIEEEIYLSKQALERMQKTINESK